MVQVTSQESMLARFLEQLVDVPFPHVMEEIVEVVMFALRWALLTMHR